MLLKLENVLIVVVTLHSLTPGQQQRHSGINMIICFIV